MNLLDMIDEMTKGGESVIKQYAEKLAQQYGAPPIPQGQGGDPILAAAGIPTPNPIWDNPQNVAAPPNAAPAPQPSATPSVPQGDSGNPPGMDTANQPIDASLDPRAADPLSVLGSVAGLAAGVPGLGLPATIGASAIATQAADAQLAQMAFKDETSFWSDLANRATFGLVGETASQQMNTLFGGYIGDPAELNAGVQKSPDIVSQAIEAVHDDGDGGRGGIDGLQGDFNTESYSDTAFA